MKILSILLLFITSLLCAQKKLLTHTEVNGPDKIVLSYYKDASTTALNIKHGAYLYTKNSKNFKVKTTGTYSNGLRNGLWRVDYDLAGQHNNSYDDYNNFRTTITHTISYKNGQQDGDEKVSILEQRFNGLTRVFKKETVGKRTIRFSDIESLQYWVDGNLVTDNYYDNGILKPGEYCFNCDNRDGVFVKINADGIVTEYYYREESKNEKVYEDVDEESARYGKMYKDGLMSADDLKRKGLKIHSGRYFGSTFPDGTTKSYLPNDGLISEINFKNPLMVYYEIDRNTQFKYDIEGNYQTIYTKTEKAEREQTCGSSMIYKFTPGYLKILRTKVVNERCYEGEVVLEGNTKLHAKSNSKSVSLIDPLGNEIIFNITDFIKGKSFTVKIQDINEIVIQKLKMID